MKTTPSHVTAYDSASVPTTEPLVRWLARIRGEPEPLFLSRLLQRLTTQQALIESLRYELASDHHAMVEITFRAPRSRADLLTRQWQTLISVHETTLRRMET